MEAVLHQRRDSLQGDIDRIQAKIDKGEKDLALVLKKAPKRPCSGTDAQRMEKEIADLEYHRQTTSMKLNEEKEVIKKMNSLRKTISELGRFQDYDASIQAVKRDRDQAWTDLKAKRTELGEVRHAQRILSASTSLNIPVENLKSEEVRVPTEHISAIIGRGGETLRALSQEYQVTMDTRKLKDGGTLMVVIGLDWGVAQAVDRIRAIQTESVVSLSVSKEVFMFVDKSPSLRQQCQVVRGVSMTLIRLADGKTEIRLRGSDAGVLATKQFLGVLATNLESVEVSIDRSALPALIGAKGVTIKQLAASTGALFSIEQSNDKSTDGRGKGSSRGGRNSKGGRGGKGSRGPPEGVQTGLVKVQIVGSKSSVKKGVEALRSIESENKQVEERVTFNKVGADDLAMMFSAPSGVLVRQLRDAIKGTGTYNTRFKFP
jgi:predicted PilT family ATPase